MIPLYPSRFRVEHAPQLVSEVVVQEITGYCEEAQEEHELQRVVPFWCPPEPSANIGSQLVPGIQVPQTTPRSSLRSKELHNLHSDWAFVLSMYRIFQHLGHWLSEDVVQVSTTSDRHPLICMVFKEAEKEA